MRSRTTSRRSGSRPPREAIPELEALIAAHPLRERSRRQKMLALYRSGRQAEALRSSRARGLLVDELGIEPGDGCARFTSASWSRIRRSSCPPRRRSGARLPEPPAVAEQGQGPEPPRVSRRRPVALGALAAVALGVGVVVSIAALGVGSSTGTPSPPANSLVLLDPASGEIRRELRRGRNADERGGRRGAAWVLNADDSTISRIDADTHSVRTFGSGVCPRTSRLGPARSGSATAGALARSSWAPLPPASFASTRVHGGSQRGAAAGGARLHERPPTGSHRGRRGLGLGGQSRRERLAHRRADRRARPRAGGVQPPRWRSGMRAYGRSGSTRRWRGSTANPAGPARIASA